jgi:hypothetical protein
LYNNTLLPTTVKVLEVIFKSLFSSPVAFLMTSVALQKRRPFTADFIEEAGKNQLTPG